MSVTIVDEYVPNDNSVNGYAQNSQVNPNDTVDIIYADNNTAKRRPNNNSNNNNYDTDTTVESEDPDEFLHEVPVSNDASAKYRDEQTDQFFHELPRSRTRANYQSPTIHVETRPHGAPKIYSEDLKQDPDSEVTNKNATKGTDQQAKLIDLYTGNGGVTEVSSVTPTPRPSAAYTAPRNNNNNNYNNDNENSDEFKDVGGIRARVIQVTPAPPNAVPQETSKTRRVVVSKHVTTVQEVEIPVRRNNTANVTRTNNNSAENSFPTPGHAINVRVEEYPSSTPGYSSEESGSDEDQFSSSTPNYSSSTPEYDAVVVSTTSDYGTRRNGEYNAADRRSDVTSGESDVQYMGDASVERQKSGRLIAGDSNDAQANQSGYVRRTVVYVRPVSQEFAQLRAKPPRN